MTVDEILIAAQTLTFEERKKVIQKLFGQTPKLNFSDLANGENVAAPKAADTSSLKMSELEAAIQAQGHKLFGVFADDPGAMEVFDEIERLRDQHPLSATTMP
jgi:hypothetical protein